MSSWHMSIIAGAEEASEVDVDVGKEDAASVAASCFGPSFDSPVVKYSQRPNSIMVRYKNEKGNVFLLGNLAKKERIEMTNGKYLHWALLYGGLQHLFGASTAGAHRNWIIVGLLEECSKVVLT